MKVYVYIDKRIERRSHYKVIALRVLEDALEEKRLKKKKLYSICTAIGWLTIPGPYIVAKWSHTKAGALYVEVYDK